MIFIDLIVNLALLVALTIVSGFIDKRWPRTSRPGMLLQGALFGAAAVVDEKGRPLHFITGAQDITQRKPAERKLLEKVEALRHFRDKVVGRELVMIELKEEIYELPRRNHSAPPHPNPLPRGERETQCRSNSLSPVAGERVGVRGCER